MEMNKTIERRNFLRIAGGAGLAALSAAAGAQSFSFLPNQRYPDPNVLILDPSFAKHRIYSSTIEQVATGFRWAEGPAYSAKGGYLLFSDIPNNRIMKFDEATGKTTVYREKANFANGNVFDRQGRLITCEHSVTRRVTRTEANGKLTVLADSFEGKRLNAPNDVVVKSDDTIWFTDPVFGINGEWEGFKGVREQANTNVFRIGTDGKLTAVITDLVNPNGLAFCLMRKNSMWLSGKVRLTAASGVMTSTQMALFLTRKNSSMQMTKVRWMDSKSIPQAIFGAVGAAMVLWPLNPQTTECARFTT